MSSQFNERIELFSQPDHLALLKGIRRGIEKESLRTNYRDGRLATTPHPVALGSALTHPSVTTDFSESLLELITGAYDCIDTTLGELSTVHRFVYSQLDNELLWGASMPCILGDDAGIPLARYGSSNVATMKTAYRRGLGHRYGRRMQTIAGIHYNFSLPAAIWPVLQAADASGQSPQEYTTDAYFNLIRNFRRCVWLLVYLFGASPAICKSFLRDQPHQLDDLDKSTLYLPYGTSLRMGDVGYQSNAQQSLFICYNSLDNYIHTLSDAITLPHANYEKIGRKVNGEYQQLSTALLQIENEFYSPVRPKRVTRSGETPLGALNERGVEYIEVRCLDVNPYLPMGIDAEQIRFLDSFLLYCLFDQSPSCDDNDRERINNNLIAVVNEGRRPDLVLERRNGATSLRNWGGELLNGIERVARLLDRTHGGNHYAQSCASQRAKLLDPTLTPSAQLLADLRREPQPFTDFALRQSQRHAEYFLSRPLAAAETAKFRTMAEQSLAEQRAIEEADSLSFDEYLADYYRQYEHLQPTSR